MISERFKSIDGNPEFIFFDTYLSIISNEGRRSYNYGLLKDINIANYPTEESFGVVKVITASNMEINLLFDNEDCNRLKNIINIIKTKTSEKSSLDNEKSTQINQDNSLKFPQSFVSKYEDSNGFSKYSFYEKHVLYERQGKRESVLYSNIKSLDITLESSETNHGVLSIIDKTDKEYKFYFDNKDQNRLTLLVEEIKNIVDTLLNIEKQKKKESDKDAFWGKVIFLVILVIVFLICVHVFHACQEVSNESDNNQDVTYYYIDENGNNKHDPGEIIYTKDKDGNIVEIYG